MFPILLLFYFIGFSHSLSCSKCEKEYCDSHPPNCPPSQQIKDICGCCNECGALKGETCKSNIKAYDIQHFFMSIFFIYFIRCSSGLRCVTDFGCRYKYRLPWSLPIQGKCQEELPNEPDTDGKCYQYGYLMKQIKKET